MLEVILRGLGVAFAIVACGVLSATAVWFIGEFVKTLWNVRWERRENKKMFKENHIGKYGDR